MSGMAFSEMAHRPGLDMDSSPEERIEKGNYDLTAGASNSVVELTEGQGARTKKPSTVRDLEGDFNERKFALFNSRSGHIGNLTKIYSEITRLMGRGGTRNDVLLEAVKFEQA